MYIIIPMPLKRLAKSLSYSYVISSRSTYGSHTVDIGEIPVEQVGELENVRASSIRNNYAHTIFKSAIRRLESLI